ncbi:MFS transporter [Cnuibacter sp. UC19_7]|uniref:MFS transporter n=1 Tax=Cnuibacter sp. UC19_7 TaxID=3350166 RepID=UPI003672DD97
MPTPRTPRVVALLLLVIPLSQLPIDIYTPAIPRMITELGAPSTLVQNSVSAYVLGMALGLVPVGVLADALGRRPVLLSCLALLCVSSVAIAFCGDAWLLLGLRFVQGLGGCACMVVVYAIAADVARGRELTSLSGWLGAAWGLAPVIAPAVGGIIVQFVSWRMIFVLVAVLAGVVAVLVWRLLPETLAASDRVPVQLRPLARVLGAALRRPLFLGLTLVFALFASAQLLFGVVAPLLYEVRLGIPPGVYGLLALAIGAANLAGELATGALAKRIRPAVLGFGAFAFFAAGTAVLLVTGLTVGADTVWLTVGGMLVMLGCGALCPFAYGQALGLFDRSLGLIGGLTSAVCYLVVSVTMTAAAGLPDDSVAPMAVVYVGCGALGAILLALCLRAMRSPVAVPAASR